MPPCAGPVGLSVSTKSPELSVAAQFSHGLFYRFPSPPGCGSVIGSERKGHLAQVSEDQEVWLDLKRVERMVRPGPSRNHLLDLRRIEPSLREWRRLLSRRHDARRCAARTFPKVGPDLVEYCDSATLCPVILLVLRLQNKQLEVRKRTNQCRAIRLGARVFTGNGIAIVR